MPETLSIETQPNTQLQIHEVKVPPIPTSHSPHRFIKSTFDPDDTQIQGYDPEYKKEPNPDNIYPQSLDDKNFYDQRTPKARTPNNEHTRQITNTYNTLPGKSGEKFTIFENEENLKKEIKDKVIELKLLTGEFKFNNAFKNQVNNLLIKYNDKSKPYWAVAKELENIAVAFELYAEVLNRATKESKYYDNNFRTKIQNLFEDIKEQNYTDTLELISHIKSDIIDYSQSPFYKSKMVLEVALNNPMISDQGLSQLLNLETYLSDERVTNGNIENLYQLMLTKIKKITNDNPKEDTIKQIPETPTSVPEVIPAPTRWTKSMKKLRDSLITVKNIVRAGAITAGLAGVVNPEFVSNPQNLEITRNEAILAAKELKNAGLGPPSQTYEALTQNPKTVKDFVEYKVDATPPGIEARSENQRGGFISLELEKIAEVKSPSKKEIIAVLEAAKGKDETLNLKLTEAITGVKNATNLNKLLQLLFSLGLISLGSANTIYTKIKKGKQNKPSVIPNSVDSPNI